MTKPQVTPVPDSPRTGPDSRTPVPAADLSAVPPSLGGGQGTDGAPTTPPATPPATGAAVEAMGAARAASGHGTAFCAGRLKQQREDGRVTCTRPAGWGTEHVGIGRCKLHGGATRNHTTSARNRQARALLGTLGVAADVSKLPVVKVHAELQLSMAKQLAAVRWLEEQVGALEPEEVAASPWPKLLAEHRRDADRLLVECARLGIELAAVRLEEEQGRILVGFIEGLLRELGQLVERRTGRPAVLDPMDPDVREVVRLQLAALEGPAVLEVSA